jgi:hypothetical protein
MANLLSVLSDHYQRNGDLVPRKLWEEARPEDAPLHHRFEWDNSIAGDAYRDIQAAKIIRSVSHSFVNATGEKKFIRAFYSSRESGDSDREGYRPTEEIVEDDVALLILLKDFERDLADLKRNYGHLREFADMMRAAVA